MTGLELELVEAVHRLAEVPARCRDAERSARRGSFFDLRDLGVGRVCQLDAEVRRSGLLRPALNLSFRELVVHELVGRESC